MVGRRQGSDRAGKGNVISGTQKATFPSPRIGKVAVVVGAGMARLTAARALTEFFERVIVLDNDTLPKETTFSPGTPLISVLKP